MWFLALRHLWKRKTQTLLTFLAIVLGSAGYVVFSGMQLGFQQNTIERLINTDGHIKITPQEKYITEQTIPSFFEGNFIRWVRKPSGRKSKKQLSSSFDWYAKLSHYPEIEAFTYQFSQDVILKNGSFSLPINLIGIIPEKQKQVTNLAENMKIGKLEYLDYGSSLIIVGEDLLRYLGASVKDTVSAITPSGSIYPVKIIGVFQTGHRGTDSRTAFASLSTVQAIAGASGQISRIIIKLKNVENAKQIASHLRFLTEDKVESWEEANENFLSVIATQNTVRLVTTFTLILVIAFGIYNILNMVVIQKRKDIAILRSMGYTRQDTIFLFLIQGVLLGIIGSLIGLGIGAIINSYLETIKMPRGNMRISWDMMIYVTAFILVVGSSFIASVIPARQAGKLSPIEIIKGN